MSVSALCTLALKASPSPLATLREYSMNHNHAASTSLPNSFLPLPRCVPSQAPASSPSPSQEHQGEGRWTARALYSTTGHEQAHSCTTRDCWTERAGRRVPKSAEGHKAKRLERVDASSIQPLCQVRAWALSILALQEYSWDRIADHQGWGSQETHRDQTSGFQGFIAKEGYVRLDPSLAALPPDSAAQTWRSQDLLFCRLGLSNV